MSIITTKSGIKEHTFSETVASLSFANLSPAPKSHYQHSHCNTGQCGFSHTSAGLSSGMFQCTLLVRI